MALNAGRFSFMSDHDAVKAFMRWMKRQLETELKGRDENELWAKYIKQTFAKGAGRSFDDVKRTQLLDLLGGALLRSTRILNCLKGGHKEMQGGLPIGLKLRGWLSKTMVVNSLDSDLSQPLEFYHRVMYAG